MCTNASFVLVQTVPNCYILCNDIHSLGVKNVKCMSVKKDHRYCSEWYTSIVVCCIIEWVDWIEYVSTS